MDRQIISGGELLNIPNIITSFRFILIPFFGYFLFMQQYGLAAFFFLLSGFSDILDGFLARKLNMITSWGKIADPVADKLMQITALVLLTMQLKIPPAIIIIVVAKEIFMGIGSILLYKKENFVVHANWYGKLATVIFYLAIAAIIMFDLEKPYNELVIGIALVSTLFAFFMYSLAYRKIRNSSK